MKDLAGNDHDRALSMKCGIESWQNVIVQSEEDYD
jgi:hypothetical protein